MRTSLAWALALALPAATLRAADHDTALAVVAEAIRAHGGEDALARTATFVRKSAGKMTVAGKEMPFAEELTAQLPDRWRRETETLAGGQKLRVLLVVNGDRAWQSAGGAAVEVGAERLKELREDAHARRLTTLLPLKNDSSLRLAPLPEVKVDGEPALGVRVTVRGHAEVSLYFDKKSRLLVRAARQATEAGETATREETYSGYKEFDGVKLPTKVIQTVGGKKLSETVSADYTFPRKLDEGTFAKP
jgi:hypothetical protein